MLKRAKIKISLTKAKKRIRLLGLFPAFSLFPMRSVPFSVKPSVLVVDDNQDAAEALQMLFEMHGYVARCEFEGGAGLTAALMDKPDFLVLDLDLPGLTGCEIARVLRTLPDFQYRPLVALSGYVDARHVDDAMTAGFNRYFPKPVVFENLNAYLMSFR